MGAGLGGTGAGLGGSDAGFAGADTVGRAEGVAGIARVIGKSTGEAATGETSVASGGRISSRTPVRPPMSEHPAPERAGDPQAVRTLSATSALPITR